MLLVDRRPHAERLELAAHARLARASPGSCFVLFALLFVVVLMAVELVYETHSTSVDNENGIATGWLDGRLSELGRRQAEELGARRRDVAAVYASDLGRAVETAAIAFRGAGIPVHHDARLRECDYGELNGATRGRGHRRAARARRRAVPRR